MNLFKEEQLSAATHLNEISNSLHEIRDIADCSALQGIVGKPTPKRFILSHETEKRGDASDVVRLNHKAINGRTQQIIACATIWCIQHRKTHCLRFDHNETKLLLYAHQQESEGLPQRPRNFIRLYEAPENNMVAY